MSNTVVADCNESGPVCASCGGIPHCIDEFDGQRVLMCDVCCPHLFGCRRAGMWQMGARIDPRKEVFPEPEIPVYDMDAVEAYVLGAAMLTGVALLALMWCL